MDTVLITDLSARGIIGVNDWERIEAQEIVINLALFTEMASAGETDDIADCVNYQTLSDRVRSLAETARRFTVEALACDIARLCLEDPAVLRVRVRIEKPGAVRFSRSVGVEIERERASDRG